MGDPLSLEEKFKDPESNNWLKAVQILREFKVGISSFVEVRCREVQEAILQTVLKNQPQHVTKVPVCTECTKDTLNTKTLKKKKGCPEKVCPQNVCTLILEEMKKIHKRGNIEMSRTDVSSWTNISRYWEIARTFMGKEKEEKSTEAADTDCTGLLSIIINCMPIHKYLTMDMERNDTVFHQVKKLRNEVMHSHDSRLKAALLQDLIKACVQILDDPKTLAADKTAKDAIKRINKIERMLLTVSNVDYQSVFLEVQENQRREISEMKTNVAVLAQKQASQEEDISDLARQQALQVNKLEECKEEEEMDERRMSADKEAGPALPIEILRMDSKSVELYKMALTEGEEVDHSIRIMIIGHFDVGKTTLACRLLGEPVDIQAKNSTNGIAVHIGRCKVLLSDLTWHSLQSDEKSETALKRLAKMIASRSTGEDAPTPADEEILKTSAAKTESSVRAVGGAKKIVDVQGDAMLNIGENTQYISKPLYDKEEKEEDEDTACIEEMKALVAEMTKAGFSDPREFASVSLWDFAGQYVFYTTHQMFLSPRVVYLLVTDISKHISKKVEDECYIDSSGLKQCNISEFVDFWLNSIHTCSPYASTVPPDASTVPPVILVGTKADKLTEATVTDDADFRQRGENRDKRARDYFDDVRNHLSEKQTRFHLADKEFDIDNTDEDDSKLEDLKKKIVEVAQRQPHWGQLIPAKWLRLETVLCGLKDTGLKIVDFVRIEELNLAMFVPISTSEELKLFLQFHHESGNILYFSEGSLQEKVVVDPQWLVDALNSLITTKMICNRKYPHVTKEWNEFDSNGILRPQLLDALWQKDNNPTFHDNRAHLLALMEKMNLISRPMLWHKDDATPTKEDYYLAPCMLKDKPREDLLSPSHGENCETTSILVFYFQREFVPTAVFHRLLAACLSKWSLWRDGDSGLIFCGCGVFQIDHSHKLTLVFRDFNIQAFVSKYGLQEKSPRKEICIAVLEFLDECLTFVTGSIATFSHYDLRIKCPKNNAMIPVSELQNTKEYVCSCHAGTPPHVFNSVDILKYWFPDSVTTGHITDPQTGPQQTHREPSPSNQQAQQVLPEYSMTRKPRGICVIINIKHFKRHKSRKGTDVDRGMGYLLDSNSEKIPIKELTYEFQANRCRDLAGKPKLFFFQACRGNDKMRVTGAKIKTDSTPPLFETDGDGVPDEADFLLGYSTVPGYVSYRNEDLGSLYISKLVQKLDEHSHDNDLLSILTTVNEEVSYENVNMKPTTYTQVPAPSYTLTKKVYFR